MCVHRSTVHAAAVMQPPARLLPAIRPTLQPAPAHSNTHGFAGCIHSRLNSWCLGPHCAQAMDKLNLKMAQSRIATTMDECMKAAEEIGRLPLIIRPAFTLGGTGGGIAYNMDEFA